MTDRVVSVASAAPGLTGGVAWIMTAEGWRAIRQLTPDLAEAGRRLPRGATKRRVVALADIIVGERNKPIEARMAALGAGKVETW